MATAAREQHKVRGRHLGCTTPTRTTDASRLLRLATSAEPCDQEFPTGVSSPSHKVASRSAGALAYGEWPAVGQLAIRSPGDRKQRPDKGMAMTTDRRAHGPVIELLHSAGCPNYPRALALVERVRDELGIQAELHTILIA
jgi:hypothetical protein